MPFSKRERDIQALQHIGDAGENPESQITTVDDQGNTYTWEPSKDRGNPKTTERWYGRIIHAISYYVMTGTRRQRDD